MNLVSLLLAAGTVGIDPSIFVASIAAIAALGGTWLTYRSSSRANELSGRKVDLEEFREVKDRYRDMLAEADKQIDRLRDQAVRDQNEISGLRSQVRTLQTQVDLLERTVATRQREDPMEGR
jgi:peptidoglycan hydrolase CwlO-like protein